MLIQKSRIPVKDLILYGLLPSPIKIFIYKIKGYKIGKNVSIGFGSIVIGKDVSIGDNSKIGFLTIVRGEKISIGSHVSIGSTTFVDTPYLDIGDDSKINEQVFIGGLQYHDSKFVLGKNCQVMQMSFINPNRSIIVGDDTGIGLHCLIFGHTSWQNEFEGYPTEFEPIEIGNSVSLTARVFVLPGSKIGDGSVIGPNSLVNRVIPPKSLAAGYPARVINKPPNFPVELDDIQRVDILKKIVSDMIFYFRGSGLDVQDKGEYYSIAVERRRFFFNRKTICSFGVAYNEIKEIDRRMTDNKLDVFVSLKTIPTYLRKLLNGRKTMWLDIEKKERPHFWNDLGDEVALFLRRYGVRFNRVKIF